MAGYEKSKASFAEQFLPQKGDSKHELVRKIVTMAAVVILVVALVILARYFVKLFSNRKQIEIIRDIHNNTEISVTSQTTIPSGTEANAAETEPPPLVVLENMEKLVEMNPNVAGWLTVSNTKIDNVVLQTTDNDYYLNKDFYGNSNIAGQIYVDYRCVINDYNGNQSDNIIVYGHNQADGSMFGTLKKYKIKKQSTDNFSFYQQNPTFKFSNLYEEYTYKIIAIFVIEVEPSQTRDGVIFDYHNYIKFAGDRNFDKFKENIIKRTAVNTGVDFDENDKFMTLSTCSNEFEPSRLVVIGRRVRDGESPEVDTSKAEINEDMLEPDYSYIYNH